MNSRHFTIFFTFCLAVLANACSPGTVSQNSKNKGTLFIIGGGSRPDSLVQDMIDASDITRNQGYVVVLPMASSLPDTAAYYGMLQFKKQGIENISAINFADTTLSDIPGKLDSVRHAALVYIPGGSQSRFMQAVHHTPGLDQAIRKAYAKGAMIAGTSAGAAVMSKMMITGDQKKYPKYTPTFYHLENDNLITKEGLGLLPGVVIDMHFITRARNNRLLTAVMEYPRRVGIGIDESTAIIVHNNKAKVVGASQVLVYHNLADNGSVSKNGKLSAKNMRLEVYVAGNTFKIH